MRKIYGLKRICAVFAACVLALGTLGISSGKNALETAADETKNKYESQLEELKKQQKQIDDELAEAQRKIDEESDNLEAINDKYAALVEKIENVSAQTAELENQMVEIDEQLRDTRYKLEEQNAQIEQTTADFMERIRAMYVAGGTSSYENVIVNSSDFYDVLMRVELVKRVAAHDNETLNELLEQKRAIEQTESEVESQSEELQAKAQDYAEMQSELAEEQAELIKLKEESGSVINELEDDRDELMAQSQALADDYAKISSMAQTTTTTTTTTTTATTTTAKTAADEEKASTTTKKTTADSESVTTVQAATTTQQTATQAPQQTQTAAETTAGSESDDSSGDTSSGDSDSSRQDMINTVIAYAKSNVGGRYVWGGSSYRACDCSGLIMISFKQVGISLPHHAATQANYGTKVSYSDIQPGDVVFFGGSSYSSIYHVALYIGDGRIVHAENSYTGIVISNLASFSKYNNITVIKRLI